MTQGLWIAWKYEGKKTLNDYLRKGKDCLPSLGRDLGVSEVQVVPIIMSHVLESLSQLHAAGVVHRDCKSESENL